MTKGATTEEPEGKEGVRNEMQGGTCLTTSSVTPALDSSPLGPSLLTSFTSAVGGPFGAR